MTAAPTVLVIEGDPSTAAFLDEQLHADGLQARVAHSAEHARSLARQARVDAVLLGDLADARAGLDLLARVRAGGLCEEGLPAALPVMVLTRRRGELDVLRAFEAGADDVMARPFSYPELRVFGQVSAAWPRQVLNGPKCRPDKRYLDPVAGE
jgi:DNA-binding response OmpR family regulator